MLTEQILNFANCEVGIFICKGVVYFRAVDVTGALQYIRSSHAIDNHVSKKYVKTLSQLKK